MVWFGAWFFFSLLSRSFKKKKESGGNGPPVYNGLAVRTLTHRHKEFDFKPFYEWWCSNPETNVCWDSAPTTWLSSIVDDRVRSTFHLSSWNCFLSLWGKQYIGSEKEHVRKPGSVTEYWRLCSAKDLDPRRLFVSFIKHILNNVNWI